MDELLETPCGCFGGWLMRFRQERGMSLETFAAATQCTPQMLKEVEQGHRAVTSQWVRRVDALLDGDGVLILSAGDSLNCHAWGNPDRLTDYPHEGPGPIRFPAEFIASTT